MDACCRVRAPWPQVKKAMSGESTDVPPIPITVRQLEAIIRIAESLARMSLQTIATGALLGGRSCLSPPSCATQRHTCAWRWSCSRRAPWTRSRAG